MSAIFLGGARERVRCGGCGWGKRSPIARIPHPARTPRITHNSLVNREGARKLNFHLSVLKHDEPAKRAKAKRIIRTLCGSKSFLPPLELWIKNLKHRLHIADLGSRPALRYAWHLRVESDAPPATHHHVLSMQRDESSALVERRFTPRNRFVARVTYNTILHRVRPVALLPRRAVPFFDESRESLCSMFLKRGAGQ